jgi:hypothetical protein
MVELEVRLEHPEKQMADARIADSPSVAGLLFILPSALT